MGEDRATIAEETLFQFVFYAVCANLRENEPAELSPQPLRCTPPMIDAIQLLLHNEFSLEGKRQLLKAKVKEILLVALEVVRKRQEMLPVVLKAEDVEKLRMARDIEIIFTKVMPGLL